MIFLAFTPIHPKFTPFHPSLIKITSDSLLNYDNIDISGTETFDLWLTTKEQALTNELDYYTECILGNINLQNNTIQLLIPEPATATMSLLGLTALMVRRKRK